MNKELIKVNNGGAGGVIELNPSAFLSAVRTTLASQQPPLIASDQLFFIAGAPLVRSEESEVTLSDALAPQDQGPPLLTVKKASVVVPSGKTWSNLTDAQQASLLNDVIQITRGLTVGNASGGAPTVENSTMFKSTHNALSAVDSSWYTSETPRIQTSVTTNSYFSSFAESMAVSSSNSASVSAVVPFGGGEESFKEAQSRSSSHSEVTSSSVGSYNVNLAELDFDLDKIQLSGKFQSTLNDVFNYNDDPSKFIALVQALNEYGWYVPKKYVLGGALYTTQTSHCSSWSQSQSQSDDFGASFKASFDGIGGGAAYSSANTSSTTSSGTVKTSSMSFTAIGGTPADANDYAKWSASLSDVNNWNIGSYIELVPAIYPLANMGVTNKQMMYALTHLISSQYALSPELATLQPMIDCGAYVNQIKALMPSD